MTTHDRILDSGAFACSEDPSTFRQHVRFNANWDKEAPLRPDAIPTSQQARHGGISRIAYSFLGFSTGIAGTRDGLSTSPAAPKCKWGGIPPSSPHPSLSEPSILSLSPEHAVCRRPLWLSVSADPRYYGVVGSLGASFVQQPAY